MSLSLEQIRRTADRVAASHGLDVVEIEYLGGGKQRILRVFIEQNAEQRARRAAEAAAVRAKSKACCRNWKPKASPWISSPG